MVVCGHFFQTFHYNSDTNWHFRPKKNLVAEWILWLDLADGFYAWWNWIYCNIMEEKFLLLKWPVIVCSNVLICFCLAIYKANLGMGWCPCLYVSSCFHLCCLCVSYAWTTTMDGREVLKIGSDNNCRATHACDPRRAEYIRFYRISRGMPHG